MAKQIANGQEFEDNLKKLGDLAVFDRDRLLLITQIEHFFVETRVNTNPTTHDIMSAATAGSFDAFVPKFFDGVDYTTINADILAVIHSQAFLRKTVTRMEAGE